MQVRASKSEIVRLAREREVQVGPWPAAKLEILLDFCDSSGNPYLWDLLHDLDIVPGLDFLLAVRIVSPEFEFETSIQDRMIPSYRRWTLVPSLQVVADCLLYALAPPALEVLPSALLSTGDILVEGLPPQRIRFRVTGRAITFSTVKLTLENIRHPQDRFQEELDIFSPVRRETKFNRQGADLQAPWPQDPAPAEPRIAYRDRAR